MTTLLYLPDDDDVSQFTATVEQTSDNYLVLDRTHFYPEGGGQPADHGTLTWDGGSARVVDVQKHGGDVRHTLAEVDGDLPAPGATVRGEIDADRRERHRRMHTAQHVMSKVVLDRYDANVAGNQIHADRSRIDFEPARFSDEDLDMIEAETNRIIQEDRQVRKQNMPRDTVEQEMPDDRVNLDLVPSSVDPLRVVAVEDFDLCPCGGTHVDSTAEIGRVTIVDRVSKGKNVERIVFELE